MTERGAKRAPWEQYQEAVAAFFRGLGLEAETNVTLRGARTRHDIDVLVRSNHVGVDLLWIVECKKWTARVGKRDVLALREILADLGADRGFLMAERGFESGALEAAQLTNVQLTSLAELTDTTAPVVATANLRALLERIDASVKIYWQYGKDERIRFGLRPPSGQVGYSALSVLRGVKAAIDQALLGHFPPLPQDAVDELYVAGLKVEASTRNELFAALEPRVSEVEGLISSMENALGTK